MLAARGLQPGDHVSLVMGNGIQTIRLLLGAMYGGYCVHPVNLLSQPEQMRYVIDHADARVVFAAPEWIERLRDLTATIAPAHRNSGSRAGRQRLARRKRAVASVRTADRPNT